MVKVHKWDSASSCNSLSHEAHNLVAPWPAAQSSSFGCSFCKRQFRSAQALGGHMNVHRRERAQLASSLHNPPLISKSKPLTPFSNSQPSPPSHGHEKVKPMVKCACNSHIDPSLTQHQHHDQKAQQVTEKVKQSIIASPSEAHHGLDLDLNMGLLRDHPREDLDLELRLGFSN